MSDETIPLDGTFGNDDEDDSADCTTVGTSIPAPDNLSLALKEFHELSQNEDFQESITIIHSHIQMVSGRNVQWRGKEKENPMRVSSVIELKGLDENSSKPVFGQIQHFFHHKHKGKMSTFAVVEVFDKKSTVTSDGHWKVNTNLSTKIMIPAGFSYMSRPLVTARSVENKNILYILNFDP